MPALEALSESQRLCVMFVHAFGWSQADTAALLEVDPSTVRTARGLARLKHSLEVVSDVR